MSAFTVFSSDCILLNNLIDGLGVGRVGRGRGAGTNPMSSVDGQTPQTPKGSPGREAGSGGQGGKAGGGKDRPKAGPVLYTSKAYISSEQNDSFYFYAKV